MAKIALLLLLISLSSAASTFKKYTIDDSDAFCLDGTKPAYYVKEGNL
jgi:hypothetical protein